MSRIGKTPIEVPSGVEVNISGSDVEVKGSKGTLNHTLPEGISINKDENVLTLERANEERHSRALHGLSRSLVSNMVEGVSNGFKKELRIVGVGYRALAKGPTKLEMSLGYSHTIDVEAPEGVTFELPDNTTIIVNGIDKQVVGQTAAEIRSLRKPEPYKGKGVMYAGERIIRKAGKAGK
ncbi:MAG: 50S ribosomal protein L6 [Acidimicrobiales bacterium]|nr:50S ribosomal protein L6 [Acidimicrobiales bacterium]